MEEESYSIEELTARVGIPVRTLRYYIAEGLLAGPSARGKGARYNQEHLLRLQLIRRLSGQHLPLAQIRERLSRLSPAELVEMAQGPAPAQTSPRAYLESLLAQAHRAPPVASLREPDSTSWRRYSPRPGLELAVRSDLESRYAPLLRQVLKMLSETG